MPPSFPGSVSTICSAPPPARGKVVSTKPRSCARHAATSSSAATGRSGRSEAVAPARSGSPETKNGLEVALKIVPREGKAAYRAEREAEAAARLRHHRASAPTSARRQHVYIAYEYVPGRTFRKASERRARRRRRPSRPRPSLDALSHAHTRHRPPRRQTREHPLVEEGVEVSIRLLDFGLAQFEEVDALTATGATSPGHPRLHLARAPAQGSRQRAPPAMSGPWASSCGNRWRAFNPSSQRPPVEDSRDDRGGGSPAPAGKTGSPETPARRVEAGARAPPARRPPAPRWRKELRPPLEAGGVRRRWQGPSRGKISPSVRSRRARRTDAGAGAAMLPFYPRLSAAARGLAGLPAFLEPRAGLALTLVAPILPLGIVSLGLASSTAPSRSPGSPLLARCRYGSRVRRRAGSRAVGLLALVPLVAVPGARSATRRAPQALAAVPVAAFAAGLRGWDLPFRQGAEPPLGIQGDAGAAPQPLACSEASTRAVSPSRPGACRVAVALPFARTPWRLAGIGAARSRPRSSRRRRSGSAVRTPVWLASPRSC